MREIHFTFIYRASKEDEEFEDEFTDGLVNILETVGLIDNPNGIEYTIDLTEKLINP